MTHLLDYTVVGLILLLALGYAAASLGPRSWRQSVLSAMARVTRRMPRALGFNALTERISRAAGQSQGACGGCDSCGSTAAAPQAKTATGAEVTIRVDKIGRRVTR